MTAENIGDIIRILVATDNHLGYAEKDPIRGEDSFVAFEEILELAVAEDVDAILLGGDLFHDAVPSQNTLYKCMTLLRRYTFGDKPITLEFLSDQDVNFPSSVNQTVNYEDPNLNVSIPVFSIHGNHDDPSGFGRLSSLDLLATTGLVNYFGRWTDLNKVEINPLLMRKGETQLALYGLSHIHDVRLARLFEDGKVAMKFPGEEEGEWFHLLVLHQNHADRGPKNYVPEELLPAFLNLVIWGHEHDCRIEPEHNTKRDFYVSQPGSSVATSLAEGESLRKHVGLLEIYKTKFQLKPLPLKTVRPFVFESINLEDVASDLHLDEGDASNKVQRMAQQRVEAMIERAKDLLTGDPKQPQVPLVRLRLVFSKEEHMFNAIRFGQMFNERVANPSDVIHFKKIINRKPKVEDGADGKFDKDAMESAFKKLEIDAGTRVEDLVQRYFEEVNDAGQLKMFNPKVLSELCYRLVERSDTNAAENIIQLYKQKVVDHLMEVLPAEDDVAEEMLKFKENFQHDELLKSLDERVTNKSKKKTATAVAASAVKRPRKTKVISSGSSEEDVTEIVTNIRSTRDAKHSAANVKEETTNAPTTTRGRGRGRGRGAAAKTRVNITRSGHIMPQLDISIGSSRSTRQTTLLDAVSESSPRTRLRKVPTYVVSDDSD